MKKTTLTIAEGTREIGSIITEIEEIVIPDGVTSIGSFAFLDCIFLASVTIGNSVEFIGDGAFCNCPSIESIYIDKEKGSLDLSKACIPKTCKVYWKGEF